MRLLGVERSAAWHRSRLMIDRPRTNSGDSIERCVESPPLGYCQARPDNDAHSLGSLNDSHIKCHFQPLPDCTKDSRQIVHARISLGGKHAMQTLAGLLG